jgi:hypothetical protein
MSSIEDKAAQPVDIAALSHVRENFRVHPSNKRQFTGLNYPSGSSIIRLRLSPRGLVLGLKRGNSGFNLRGFDGFDECMYNVGQDRSLVSEDLAGGGASTIAAMAAWASLIV